MSNKPAPRIKRLSAKGVCEGAMPASQSGRQSATGRPSELPPLVYPSSGPKEAEREREREGETGERHGRKGGREGAILPSIPFLASQNCVSGETAASSVRPSVGRGAACALGCPRRGGQGREEGGRWRPRSHDWSLARGNVAASVGGRGGRGRPILQMPI